ncbi:MAG: FHA domain-containing protein, partial [Cystobacterineae bacterium]|nr:FHA domain-containing protein [Cystobacterineae bacterium]
MLNLLIQDNEGRKTEIPFCREEITIGREGGNTIRLTERNVSRYHARLFRHSTQIFIEDLKSSNGIHVNGHRIHGHAVLHQGDTIVIGDYDIVLDGIPSSPTPPLPIPSLQLQNNVPLASSPEVNTDPNLEQEIPPTLNPQQTFDLPSVEVNTAALLPPPPPPPPP